MGLYTKYIYMIYTYHILGLYICPYEMRIYENSILMYIIHMKWGLMGFNWISMGFNGI